MLTPQCALHTQTKIGALGQKKRLHWWFWKALNFYTTSDFDSFTFYIVPADATVTRCVHILTQIQDIQEFL